MCGNSRDFAPLTSTRNTTTRTTDNRTVRQIVVDTLRTGRFSVDNLQQVILRARNQVVPTPSLRRTIGEIRNLGYRVQTTREYGRVYHTIQ